MKFARLAFVSLCSMLASAAFGHGSSHPKSGSDGGSVINADVAPRAIIWDENRLWQSETGIILICPKSFAIAIASRQWADFYCYNENVKGEGKQTRWMALQDYKVEGMVLKSYEYRFIGSSGTKVLIAYYGPVVADTTKESVVTLTDPISIKTDKMVIQRRAK